MDFWRDKSGGGRHAGNGNGPDLQINRWNNLSTLKFDGNSQYLRVTIRMFLILGRTEQFLLLPKGTIRVHGANYSKRGGSGMGWQFRRVNTEFTSFTIRGTSDWDDRSGGTPFNGDPHVWSLRKSAVRKAQWADGNLEFQVLDTGSVAPAPNHDLVIAAHHENGSIVSHSNIEVAEIIIYDSALSDTDVSKVQGYLAHKWGITEPLPGSHLTRTASLFLRIDQVTLLSPYSLLLDQNVSISISTNRPANQIVVTNLPPGLDFNASNSQIFGQPNSLGAYISKFETSNASGSISKNVEFQVKDYRPWIFSSEIDFPGYTESINLNDFPVYLELNIDSWALATSNLLLVMVTILDSLHQMEKPNWSMNQSSGT